MGLNIEEQRSIDRFRQQVVDPSATKLVIVDFWAEWCGPCKALAPMLEKVAAEYADKGVLLVKLNVDEEKFIAAQFQVQSIPAVYAMFQGQPVADLTPARSESQLKQALDQLLTQFPVQAGADGGDDGAPDLDQLVAMGEQELAGGDAERAAAIFMQITQIAPENAGAQSGLIRAFLAAGHNVEAQAALDALPPTMQEDPLIKQVASALELAATAVDDSALQTLRAAAAERPADMDAQLEFGQAAFAAGSRDEAADVLLKAIETDPEWNDGAAKAKLLQMFEVVGLEDPWVSAQRRRLSILLFG